MKFDLDEELGALAELAREVLGSEATTERVRDVERSESRWDEKLWGTLAETGLLGAFLAEEHGGAELGLSAASVVLMEQGRHVAPIPLWSHVVAAYVLARFGADADTARLLEGCADGSRRLTVALEEFGVDPREPALRAERDDFGIWRLSGQKALVPGMDGAAAVLVSAQAVGSPALFLVRDGAAGVTAQDIPVTSREISATLTFDDVEATAVGEPGGPALRVALSAARIALAAMQVGVTEGALAHAVSYLSERVQFGRPLGSFQAVQHQLADCWIDIEAMRLAMWQAVTALTDDAESDAAEHAALVAAWWSSHAGLDTVHRVQHVHGGMGVDVDYPVHRHFLWGKQIANSIGGEESALEQLGKSLPKEVGA